MPASIVQQDLVTSTNGFGTTHDLPFPAGVTTGNTIFLILFGDEDPTSCTINGVAGPPNATNDFTNVFASGTANVYRYSNAAAGATGFRIVTATSHLDAVGWVVEVSGASNTTPFTASGTFPDDFEPVELDATASVNAAGDFALAEFKFVTLANITSTRSGFTQSSESQNNVLLQYNMNSGATSVTAGASLSANSGFVTAGFVVTYKADAGGGGGDVLLGQALM